MSLDKIKPCPFCERGNCVINDPDAHSRIECASCNVSMWAFSRESIEELIQRWNRNE